MAENTSEESHAPRSDPGQTEDLHERAARLKKKVGDLSETFERVEQTLAEATEERSGSRA
jgi:hypothetical protein